MEKLQWNVKRVCFDLLENGVNLVNKKGCLIITIKIQEVKKGNFDLWILQVTNWKEFFI